MKINNIISDRNYQTWPSWHIVYEWEDEILNSLKLSLKKSPNYKKTNIFRKIDEKFLGGEIERLLFEHNNKTLSIYFEMCPKGLRSFSSSKVVIPIIIDFFVNEFGQKKFNKIYKYCPYLIISSLEVYNILKNENLKPKLLFLPLSLPTKYKLDSNTLFDKKYDLVLAGRQNPVLMNYLGQFLSKNPDFEYLEQVSINGELYYQSNKNGVIGKFHSRIEYFNLLKSAKVSFYSTPGIDGGEKRTLGFNPLTPRFFELLSAGCHIIARYPKNADTAFFDINSICPSIESYEQFEKQLTNALIEDQPIKRNSIYLEKHYTSERIKTIKDLFNLIEH